MRQKEREKGEGERHTGKNERQKVETEREREREGGRESEKKHVRHILCYKMYKTLDGMKHHTQS